MRYLVGFVFLVGLCAWPLGAGAQELEEETVSESNAAESVPAAEHGKGGLSPRLRERSRRNWDANTYELRLDSSGVSVSAPPPSREKADRQLQQYRQGLILSSVFVAIGGALIGSGVAVANKWERNEEKRGMFPGGAYALYTLGAVAALGGIIGLAVSGSNFRFRKRRLRKLDEAGHVRLGRAHWDVTKSRLEF